MSFVGPFEAPDLKYMKYKTSAFRVGPISEIGVILYNGYDFGDSDRGDLGP